MGGAGAAASAAGKQQLTEARNAVRVQLERALHLAEGGSGSVRLREAVTFGHVGDLVRTAGGIGGAAEPRHTVLAALREPKAYLGDIKPEQTPHNAVAYQILSEGARLVNLYDWYNSLAALRGSHMHDMDGDVGMTGTA